MPAPIRRLEFQRRLATLACGLALLAPAGLHAQTLSGAMEPSGPDVSERSALHGQATNVTQWHPKFHAPYTGANSLDPDGRAEETTDVTLYAGTALWRGAEFWINPEIDQGFGLSDTLGVAGFPSGEAYKVGENRPYLRLPRAFVRQVIALGGESGNVEGAANQLAGPRPVDNLTLTVGKFSVVDVFDANAYAHDPRTDFLNWSIVDSGAFDYAADPWGFTYGAAAEWTQDRWTWRAGLFQLSPDPNGKVVSVDFSKFMVVGEAERRYAWRGRPGKARVLLFANRAPMARYEDAVRLASETGTVPDVALVRRRAWRAGAALNVEQELAPDLGVFLRASVDDGSKEAYEFTEINRSLAAGLSMKGARWKRESDTVGFGLVANGLSHAARDYFSLGGLGILIGDGAVSYRSERIVEAYYSLDLYRSLALTFDYQYVDNPAYNADRGPVDVYAIRVHAEF
ncbi:MAG TPA: carbohydrate porin [Usitatibacter sp.]|nr:carbohydrate porin [Usitatibacter sp.]